MKILKAAFFFLFIILLFFSGLRLANGQTGDLSWEVTGLPGQREIDGNTPNAEIVFSGLEPNKTYYLYRKTDQTGAKNPLEGLKDTINSENNGTIRLVVCGDGKDKLKGEKINGKTCKEDRSDYFHEGSIYRLGLYDDNKGEAQVMVAEFYVQHTVPIIKLGTVKRGTFQAVTVALSGRRPGPGDMSKYQLALRG